LPRPSKIDKHPKGNQIVRRLVRGDEYPSILLDFPELTKWDLDYYVKNKLPQLLAESPELKTYLADDSFNEIKDLKTRTMQILDESQQAGDLRTALLGIREARECLELLFKTEGKIREQQINITQQQINIITQPEWIRLREKIVRLLQPYPEASRALANGLDGT